MKALSYFCLLLLFVNFSCKDKSKRRPINISPAVATEAPKKVSESFKVTPIEHASMLLSMATKNIYVDPVGKSKAYKNLPQADFILITDIHHDHLDQVRLADLTLEKTKIIAPEAVQQLLPPHLQAKTTVLKNGDSIAIGNLSIKAIPMYNLREEAKKFHPKGRGNGYLLSSKDFTVYIAGDTEDIPEMRKLKGIDVAFIPMNLPYTMPVDKAADAVLDFQPQKVYPYHYQGKNGLSNVALFKNIVETNAQNIKVVQLDWYPKK